jgi:hypothetical protein
MIKSVTIIEPAEGWTLARLSLPTTYSLRAEGRPELGVFSFPGALFDCRIIVDATGEPAAWVHGTDCTLTKAVRASMDERESAPFLPECARRAQGGSFRTIRLPLPGERS